MRVFTSGSGRMDSEQLNSDDVLFRILYFGFREFCYCISEINSLHSEIIYSSLRNQKSQIRNLHWPPKSEIKNPKSKNQP